MIWSLITLLFLVVWVTGCSIAIARHQDNIDALKSEVSQLRNEVDYLDKQFRQMNVNRNRARGSGANPGRSIAQLEDRARQLMEGLTE
jgi:outer membrane murein-binding lipoprotein Lpp